MHKVRNFDSMENIYNLFWPIFLTMKRFTLLFIALLLPVIVHCQEKRLALVIGNAAYVHGGELRNPVNDARAISAELLQLGFDVLTHTNLDQSGMKRAIDEFGMKLRAYDAGLFFYAGHGIQAKGENYLIPVEVNLLSEQQVEYDCVEIARVLGQMDASGSAYNIIILDACRNNPFERSWSRASSGKGLAFMDAPSGTLIAYATAPGRTASDGTGDNGLYTGAILQSMKIPGLNILEMFQNVRQIVKEVSNDQQIPWESTSMVGNFYFNAEGAAIASSNQQGNVVRENETDLKEDPEFDKRSGLFTDHRDGMDYVWIRIGDQVWMGENLNYKTEKGSMCYKDKEKNCDRFGRLYDFKTAQKVCPDGWHLPSIEEWTKLQEFVISKLPDTLTAEEAEKLAGHFLKSYGKWKLSIPGGRKTVGFEALPAGYREGSAYLMEDKYAVFWTSELFGAGKAYCVMLTYSNSFMDLRTTPIRGYSFSARCIKDE